MDFNLQACQSARTVPSLFNSIKPSKLYMYLKLDSSPRVSRQKKCEQRLRGFFMLILTGMINSFCAWFCDENSFFKTLAEGAHTENGNFYHKESAQIFIDFFGDLTGYGKHQPFSTWPSTLISNALLQTQAGHMLSKTTWALDSESPSRGTRSHLRVRAEDMWTHVWIVPHICVLMCVWIGVCMCA